MSDHAPYCKTSAEAFVPGAVFPNGYRRATDERTVEQKLLDLQNECFRRMEAQDKAIAKLTAELSAERAARQHEVAALRGAHTAVKAEHAKRIEQMRGEQRADRHAHERALCQLQARLSARFTRLIGEVIALQTAAMQREVEPMTELTFEALRNAIPAHSMGSIVNKMSPSARNRAATKFNGTSHARVFARLPYL